MTKMQIPNKLAASLSAGQPRFATGDLVRERFPFASAAREVGTVIKRYEFENQYRYVVKFENGREDVFFGRELLSVEHR
jgi:hypothetical protein